MREIKFRAWDKRQEILITVDQVMRLEFGKSGVDWLGCWIVIRDADGDPEQGLYQVPSKDLELMQFTGLLDKNGREIYEGDIVKWHAGTEFLLLYPRENMVVEFDTIPTACGWVLRNYKELAHNYSYLLGAVMKDVPWEYQLEIIGNIYENKELLENK